ncbi:MULTISPECIES: acyl-CoA dehydrogenase family protein [unclassified Nocardioides]|uniref:acyl-CoA dehydrogenase family protein n=1 Tax=unclassified Nocardioides TaxID=2615069 RepID=UPI0009F066A0|nr:MULTISPECIES: acyl-CoA dehydrogenase family protein [unclassified Nocardioides]GAW52403.1 Acyl-CoA dehydrogenase domain-containing protein [Nocardioides sp. PD653-B2]GAW53927.1 Acyl-CoA dehydrogenase domain-containing protein [Nocardioides sp. PD653]
MSAEQASGTLRAREWDQQELDEVRSTVRALVDEWLAAGRFTPGCDSWLRRYDAEFSRAMGERGLIGVSWPREVGGGGRSGLARLVITEELLRVGAPVAAHWIADRQIGPSILAHGSDAVKAAYLPRMASGEWTFCLGMSETEAGSDLASVRTVARREEGGWRITGRKIWTSHGHRATHAYVLARTGKSERKHEGLSEFIVDMRDPGVEVRPIFDLRGEHHFNEVTFDSVPVADDHVLGEIGNGWKQVTEQLSLERGGIERVMSTYPLLEEAVAEVAAREQAPAADAVEIGEALARLATLRAMAFDVAVEIHRGRAPVAEAAMLKDLGTTFEREVNEVARRLVDREADLGDGVTGLLGQGILAAPGFTIRGGTTEVLRTLVTRGTAVRASRPAPGDEANQDLREVVDDVLADRGGEPEEHPTPLWNSLADLGWTAVGVREDAGGEGGDLADVATIVEGLGRHHASVPLAETLVARRVLAAAGLPWTTPGAVGVVADCRGSGGVRVERTGADQVALSGRVARVPWGRSAQHLVLYATDAGGEELAVYLPTGRPGVDWADGANLAGEPRDTLVLDGVPAEVLLSAPSADTVRAESALLTAAMLCGALQRAFEQTVTHASTREQFGRPLIRFQAVANLVAGFASELEQARVALRRAVSAAVAGDPDAWTRAAAARVMAGRAATEGARVAHQVHAAMGVTREHPLHLSTRRLWSWRDEAGTQRWWSERLGHELLGRGPDGRWAWITEQTDIKESP